jgi:Co/Zn/Cd efflux system component
MGHDHSHDHDHHQTVTLTHVSRAFVIGIVFNFLFVVIEVVSRFIYPLPVTAERCRAQSR